MKVQEAHLIDDMVDDLPGSAKPKNCAGPSGQQEQSFGVVNICIGNEGVCDGRGVPRGDVLRDGHQADAKDECILSARCAVDCTTKLCSAAGSVGKLEKSQRRDHNAQV